MNLEENISDYNYKNINHNDNECVEKKQTKCENRRRNSSQIGK